MALLGAANISGVPAFGTQCKAATICKLRTSATHIRRNLARPCARICPRMTSILLVYRNEMNFAPKSSFILVK